MAVHHVVARGVLALRNAGSGHKDPWEDVNWWGVLVFVLTLLAYLFVMFVITYTLGRVIPVLCMIESPETSSYVPVNTINPDEPPAYEEEEDGVPKPTADESGLVRNKPITASIRATLAHLSARAGFRSKFRGFWLFIVLTMLRSFLVAFMTLGSSNILLVAPASIIAEVLLANLHMTWIHIVISDPSPKKWWQRLPRSDFGSWRRIAPAVAIFAATAQITYILPMLVIGIKSSRFADHQLQSGHRELYLTATQVTGALFLMLILFVGLQIPAMVVLVRVAASMLPEEDETIVPFDRTYGGKVTPAILGGEGKIDMAEAWRSFPWASRRRLLGLMVKISLISTAVWIVFAALMVIETHFSISPEVFRDIMRQLHGGR